MPTITARPMRLLLGLMLTFLLAGAPLNAQSAGCPEDIPPTPATVASLIRWIGSETGYDIAATLAAPPVITFCSPGDTITYEGREMLVEPGLNAAYDLPAQRIFLVRPWQPDSPRDISVLLHELTHAVQFANRSWDCAAATEWQAYQLQHKWLELRGIASGFHWGQIRLGSRCLGDIHP